MSVNMSPIDKAKFVAARFASGMIESGMRVGLGTGSTAAWMVRCLGERVQQEGLQIRGVPTSSRTAALAREVGIEVMTLDEAKWLDVTLDGAADFGGQRLIEPVGFAIADRQPDSERQVRRLRSPRVVGVLQQADRRLPALGAGGA